MERSLETRPPVAQTAADGRKASLRDLQPVFVGCKTPFDADYAGCADARGLNPGEICGNQRNPRNQRQARAAPGPCGSAPQLQRNASLCKPPSSGKTADLPQETPNLIVLEWQDHPRREASIVKLGCFSALAARSRGIRIHAGAAHVLRCQHAVRHRASSDSPCRAGWPRRLACPGRVPVTATGKDFREKFT